MPVHDIRDIFIITDKSIELAWYELESPLAFFNQTSRYFFNYSKLLKKLEMLIYVGPNRNF